MIPSHRQCLRTRCWHIPLRLTPSQPQLGRRTTCPWGASRHGRPSLWLSTLRQVITFVYGASCFILCLFFYVLPCNRLYVGCVLKQLHRFCSNSWHLFIHLFVRMCMCLVGGSFVCWLCHIRPSCGISLFCCILAIAVDYSMAAVSAWASFTIHWHSKGLEGPFAMIRANTSRKSNKELLMLPSSLPKCL